jgi:hypothetical protein
MNRYYGRNLVSGKNSTFANVNTAAPVWWLNIPLSKVEHEGCHNLLLYDSRTKELHHLEVRNAYLLSNKMHFTILRRSLNLVLSAHEPNRFRNVVPKNPGVDFRDCLKATVRCSAIGPESHGH